MPAIVTSVYLEGKEHNNNNCCCVLFQLLEENGYEPALIVALTQICIFNKLFDHYLAQ